MKIVLSQMFMTNARFCLLYNGDLNALHIITSYKSSQYYSLEQVKSLDFFNQNNQKTKYLKLYSDGWLIKIDLTST